MKKAVLVGLIVNHHSLYEYVLNILLNHFDEVLFISKSKIADQINTDQKNLNTLIDDNKINLVFHKNIDLINQNNLFITDEYSGGLVRLAKLKLKSTKKILIVHNANRWTSNILNPFNKYFIDQFFKFKFLKQIDSIVTLEPNVQSHFLSRRKDKPVFFLPFSTTEEFIQNVKKEPSKLIKILIPGTIDSERRNYKDLLDVFETYISKNQDSNIRLSFLGRIFSDKDQNIGEISDKINLKYGTRIKYWNAFIDQKEFDEEIENADLILSNIYPKIRVQGIPEFYGTSKGTGISYVYYSTAKPGIAPKFQKVMEGFDDQFIRFDSYRDLEQIFMKLDNNEYDIATLKETALRNSQKFNQLINSETRDFIQYIT